MDSRLQPVRDEDIVRCQMESHVHKSARHAITGGDKIRPTDDIPEHLLCGLLAAADDLHYHGAVLQPLGELPQDVLQGGRSADGAALHHRSLHLRASAVQAGPGQQRGEEEQPRQLEHGAGGLFGQQWRGQRVI